jgi:archaellin
MAEFTMGCGARSPALVYGLTDDDGEIINLTTGGPAGVAATGVVFRGTSTSGLAGFTGSCTITTAASGIVTYAWGASDTATPGIYRCEFVITWTGGNTQMVPTNRTLTLLVTERSVVDT